MPSNSKSSIPPQIKGYQVLDRLGKGSFGTVFLAIKDSEKQVCALKLIDAPRQDIDKQLIENEIFVMRNVKSPFLCNMYDTFKHGEQTCIALELITGEDLFNFQYKMKRFDQNTIRFYLAELVLAIECLHNNHVIHRDIKPENVMLDRRGHVKLVDFGASKVNIRKGQLTRTFCGTYQFMAPEIIKKQSYGHSVDVWSLGCLAFDLQLGKSPFSAGSEKKTIEKVLNGSVNYPRKVSAMFESLVSSMLKYDPAERIDISDLKQAKYFKSIDWEKLKKQKVKAPYEFKQNDDRFHKILKNSGVKKVMDPFSGFDYQEPTTNVLNNTNYNTAQRKKSACSISSFLIFMPFFAFLIFSISVAFFKF